MGSKYPWSKRFILIGGFTVLCVLWLTVEGSGKTITVDDDGGADFSKIQDAISASEDGDTIRVWEGTYYENVIVNKSVSLIGNGLKDTRIDGGRSQYKDVVEIIADRVNISGFSIFNSYDSGINIRSNNNTVSDVICSDCGGYGILVNYADNNTLINCECHTVGNVGIYLLRSDNNSLHNVNCHDNNIDGIRLYRSENNTITQASSCDNKQFGIWLDQSKRNVLTNLTMNQNKEGIYAVKGSDFNNMSNVTCAYNKGRGIIFYESANNIILKSDSSFNQVGFHFSYSDENLIMDSRITHNENGFVILHDSLNNNIVNNRIYFNEYFAIDSSENYYSVNATNNWWGHISGPYHPTYNPDGKGNNVTDYVIFDPWISVEDQEFGSLSGYLRDLYGNPIEGVLINITCDGFSKETTSNDRGFYKITEIPLLECIWTIKVSKYGFAEDIVERSIDSDSLQDFTLKHVLVTWYVDDDTSLGGDGSIEHPFTIIQDAIDNATDGDTIRVFEGIYQENVIVNKSVSLIGNNSELTTIDGDGNNVVTIIADWVNVSSISAINSGLWGGIRIESNNNSIENNTCSNNRFGIDLRYSENNTITNNIAKSNELTGIFLYYSNNNTINGNIASDNVYGISLSFSNDNTISNNNASDRHERGIYFGNSEGNILTNNRASNNQFGIYLYYSYNSTLTNNICSNNQRSGIFFNKSGNNTITNNTIFANIFGIQIMVSSNYHYVHYNYIFNNSDFGINATQKGGYKIVATHNWWGNSSGPYHPTNNSQGLGDNITDNVIFEPWLDEFGNLVYLPKDDPDDTPDLFLFSLLLILLICLIITLFAVVRMPQEYLQKGIQPHPKRKEKPEEWEVTDVSEISGRIVTCQHCDKMFEVDEMERAIRISCPHCGKNTLQ